MTLDASPVAGPALKMAQAASNPLVAVKHGRREDRAVVYDRFLALCVVFCRDDSEDDKAQANVDALYGALQAIELRAPRHVRVEARKLFWSIVGRPENLGLFPLWIELTATREDFEPVPVDRGPEDVPTDEELAEAYEKRQQELRRGLWVPWRFSPLPDAYSSPRDGGATGRFSSVFDLLKGIAEFTELARLDVNNRWRWWHWPMTLIPPLKRWQLTR